MMSANIKLDIRQHIGVSLAVAGIGGFAVGYSVCRYLCSSTSRTAISKQEYEETDTALTALPASVPGTPKSSVNGFSMHEGAQNGMSSDLKMALVVRSDLDMTSGTVGKHCSAAVLGLFKKLYKAKSHDLRQWELSKMKKVCHSVDGEEALLLLQASAKREGLPTRVVVDEGASNRKTVLAIGPAPGPVLQQILHGLPEL